MRNQKTNYPKFNATDFFFFCLTYYSPMDSLTCAASFRNRNGAQYNLSLTIISNPISSSAILLMSSQLSSNEGSPGMSAKWYSKGPEGHPNLLHQCIQLQREAAFQHAICTSNPLPFVAYTCDDHCQTHFSNLVLNFKKKCGII